MLYEAVFIFLSLFNLMPVNDIDVEGEDVAKVIVGVLNQPYTSFYPNLYTYAKIVWSIALLAGLAGWNRIFCIYGFISMLLIGTFQTMGIIPEWEFVWVVSLAVAIYNVAIYFLWECISCANKFVWSSVPKWRLTLLFLIPFLVWYPVSVENGDCKWDFSLQTLISNDAGVSFCTVGTSMLIIMILFYPHVHRRLFGVLVLVTSIMSLISIAAYAYQKMIPLVIIHSIVFAVSLIGYILYFSKEKVKTDYHFLFKLTQKHLIHL